MVKERVTNGADCERYSGDEYNDSGLQRISARAAACDNSMVRDVRGTEGQHRVADAHDPRLF